MNINGPGVYLRRNLFDEQDLQLLILMDTAKTMTSTQQYWNASVTDESCAAAANNNSVSTPENVLEISNLPVMKWIHVAVRVEGVSMDAYVNGTIAGSLAFDGVPYQNFYDINCCCNNGFDGSLSNLQYYNHALSAFEINRIVYAGPNLTQTNKVGDVTSYGKPYYLSSGWFLDKMGVN